MGFFKSIRSIFDTRALGEAVVEAHLTSYFALRRLHPELSEHLLLARVFVERAKLFAKVTRMPMADEDVFMEHAIQETAVMSVLDPPNSAKALGLCTLSRERPDIFAEYPEFLREYKHLMEPAMDAHAAGTFSELYRTKNRGTINSLNQCVCKPD